MMRVEHHLVFCLLDVMIIDDDVGEYDVVCLATSHITSTGDHLVAKWLQ